MVAISAVTCLTVPHHLGSVGIGTVVAAVLVGTLHGMITKMLGEKRDRVLGK